MTDIRLPGRLDGIGLAFTLRQRLPALKILIVGMDADQLAGGRAMPADRVLRKPFSLSELEGMVVELIGG